MSIAVPRRRLIQLTAGAALAPTAATLLPPTAASAADPQWQSTEVSVRTDGRLAYRVDTEGNRIPDFSHVGYRNGDAAIPDVPTVTTLSPIPGDNTAHIQAAIDAIGAMPLGADGIRGALLLEAGTYDVAGTINIFHDGVVLRGVGDGADPATNTVIHATGNTPAGRHVILVGRDDRDARWSAEIPQTRTDILSRRIAIGDREILVRDASSLEPGMNVIIQHPITEAWLAAVNHGDTANGPQWYGQGTDGPPWDDAQAVPPITYYRHIESIRGHRVTLDAPFLTTFDRVLSQSYLYQRDDSGEITRVGVEDLRVDIAYSGPMDEDEDHAKRGLTIRYARDVWARNCTFLHFVMAGVALFLTTRATIENCKALDPVSLIRGARRYNFACEADCQQILFTGCHSSGARHAYVSNGRTCDSNIVVHRCSAEGGWNASQGHRHWSHGMLFDNFTEIDSPSDRGAVTFENAGSWGNAVQAHGWRNANSVLWNSDSGNSWFIVQKPPTAQNYAIGCTGEVSGDGFFLVGPEHHGHIEGTNQPGLFPPSLYEAQLAERLGS